ncbi:MAG: FAD-binding oxidoreductase [Spirulinaceae cyanobacterium]
MKAIPTELATLLPANPNLDIVAWEDLEVSFQEKIASAIATSHLPSCAVFPHSQEALGEVVKIVHKKSWQVLVIGSGSKVSWGGLVKKADLVISTQKLSRLIDHAVGDLTVTLEAGMPLAQVQEILHKEKQFLPIDPAYPQSATIGGIIATADTGSWRQRYGGIRDMVLGISFVRADGEIAKAGGRVVKNVAGYDLMKLLTGSFGTLGVISQVTLRTYPLLQDSQTMFLSGEEKAIAMTVQTLLNSALTPTAADLLSPGVVKTLVSQKGFGLIVRFQSLTASIEAQSQRIEELGNELGLQATTYQGDAERELWQRSHSLVNNPLSPNSVISKIGVLPSSATATLAYLDEVTSGEGFGLIHNSSGIGKLQLNSEKSFNQIQKLRSHCEQNQGFLTILESPQQLKQKLEPWGYTGNAMTMMQRVKNKFDPQNILSPGRFLEL